MPLETVSRNEWRFTAESVGAKRKASDGAAWFGIERRGQSLESLQPPCNSSICLRAGVRSRNVTARGVAALEQFAGGRAARGASI